MHKNVNRALVVLTASAPLASFAQVAQPDVADTVTYMVAAAATILLVGNAKYAAAAAKAVVGWVKGVIGR